jgi:predicted RNase H-like HicB family nuclease
MNGQNRFETAEAILAELENDKNARIANPATEGDISHCNETLERFGCPAIPESCAAFLRICNGFAWNSFEFWSTSAVSFPDDPAGYKIMDLTTMNSLSDERYYKDTDTRDFYIGRSLEDIYIYNSGKKAFEIRRMKEFHGKVLGSFDSFEKLFVCVVGDRLTSSQDEGEKTIKQYIAFIRTDGEASRVVFPDFPDCVSTGKGFEDAVRTAHEALSGHAEVMEKTGEQIPEPRSLEQIKASWKDWPLWKDSDYITVLIALVPGGMTSILMDSSLTARIDRATRNRSEFLVRATEEYLDFLLDEYRYKEFCILNAGKCGYAFIGDDYTTMRMLKSLEKNSDRVNPEQVFPFEICVSEFAKAKNMNPEDAADYLRKYKGIEFLHKCEHSPLR